MVERDWIVFVDDVEAEAVAVGEALERRFGANFRIRALTSPAEALNFIRERKLKGQNTALVVTDMYMPVASNGQIIHGDELAKLLHEELDPSLPVLGFSGHNDFQNAEEARKAGLVDLLPKDATDTDSLSKRIDELLNRRYDMQSDSIVLTGPTGYLGGLFVDALLEQTSAHLFLLTRDSSVCPYNERVEIPDQYRDRVSFIKSDLNYANLGISREDRLLLLNAAPLEVWHLAASTDFDLRHDQETIRNNLIGGRNFKNFLATLPAQAVRVVNMISTAYVAGNKSYPLVSTEAIEQTLSFKNPYEESKHYVELLIDASGLPYRIFRPSVIIGHSVTGASDDKTIYGITDILKFGIKMYKRRFPGKKPHFVLPVTPMVRKNYICIDDVINAMMALRNSNAGLRNVFHLVNPYYLTFGEMFDVLADLLDIDIEYMPDIDFGVGDQLKRGIAPEEVKLIRPEAMSLLDFKLNSYLFQYVPYLNYSDPVFDTSKLLEVIPDYSPRTTDKATIRFLLSTYISNSEQ